jgi:hypothetical protein
MHALDLFKERQKNIKWVLEKIIERVDLTDIGGSQLLSAIQIYMKLNGAAQPIEQAQGATPSDGQEGKKESQVTEIQRVQ